MDTPNGPLIRCLTDGYPFFTKGKIYPTIEIDNVDDALLDGDDGRSHFLFKYDNEYEIVAEPAQVYPTPVADGAGGAVKADTGKAPLSLIPRSAQLAEARVLDFGAKKYARDNWRLGMKWSRVADAAMRHLLAWIDGENIDPETGESHLAHLRCCAGFLIEYQAEGLGEDDRYRSS